MRRALALGVAVLLAVASRGARAQPPATEIRVSLVTFGPGDELAERFGHSALRVEREGTDVLYNLGHARSSSPRFFVDVVRGEAEFEGTAEGSAPALRRYREKNRWIETQRLRLGADRARWLADGLRRAVDRGEVRYRYDHLHHNCTTEVRDWIDRASEGRLRAFAETRAVRFTYREATLGGASSDLPLLFGADLLVGPSQDRVPSGWDALYLPHELSEAVSATPGLAAPPQIQDSPRRGSVLASRYTARFFVCGLSLLAFGLAWLARRLAPRARAKSRAPAGRSETPLHAQAGVLVSLCVFGSSQVGLAAAVLAATSRLEDLSWNENLLAMWPTDLVLLRWTLPAIVGRRVEAGRLFLGYLGLRALTLAGLGVAKIAGLATQDNAWVLAAAALTLGAVFLSTSSRRTNA